jgi:hypothetical protein
MLKLIISLFILCSAHLSFGQEQYLLTVFTYDSTQRFYYNMSATVELHQGRGLKSLSILDQPILNFSKIQSHGKNVMEKIRVKDIPFALSRVITNRFNLSQGGNLNIKIPKQFRGAGIPEYLTLQLVYDNDIGQWLVKRKGREVYSINVYLDRKFEDISLLFGLPKITSIEFN